MRHWYRVVGLASGAAPARPHHRGGALAIAWAATVARGQSGGAAPTVAGRGRPGGRRVARRRAVRSCVAARAAARRQRGARPRPAGGGPRGNRNRQRAPATHVRARGRPRGSRREASRTVKRVCERETAPAATRRCARMPPTHARRRLPSTRAPSQVAEQPPAYAHWWRLSDVPRTAGGRGQRRSLVLACVPHRAPVRPRRRGMGHGVHPPPPPPPLPPAHAASAPI